MTMIIIVIVMATAAGTASGTRSIQPLNGFEQRSVEALPVLRAPHSFRALATSLGVGGGRFRLFGALS